jgi:murein L,D-transpeptidase YcbB/YkuD
MTREPSFRSPLLVSLLFAALAAASLAGCGEDKRLAATREEIRSDLKRRDMPADAPWRDRRTQSLLRGFYGARKMEPAWTNGRGMNGQARDFVERVARAEEEGLDPANYSLDALEERLDEPPKEPKTLAEADLLFTIAAFHYMSDVFDGRISPRALDATWATKPRKGDLDSVLTRALEENRIDAALRDLVPQHAQYALLRKARARVAKAIAGGDSSQWNEARLDQIELNMERWRWMPRTLGDRYLVVNIPAYELTVVEGGKPALGMKVVVGKEASKTPVFSDRMTHIVINPDWSVPDGITQNEIAPAMAGDPSHLARQRMRVFEGDQEVDAASVDWSDPEAVARVRVRQDPGEGNALGRMKFMFPNSFNVYLHDTPAGHLFSRDERGFSHGCVRVEDPMALATHLLRGRPEGRAEAIQAQIESGESKTIEVEPPMPVHLVYFTAYVDDAGQVQFRDDIYGIDADLSRQLRGRERARARQQRRASAR